jgi:hypothetical protein
VCIADDAFRDGINTERGILRIYEIVSGNTSHWDRDEDIPSNYESIFSDTYAFAYDKEAVPC